MKKITLLIVLFINVNLYSQKLKDLKPTKFIEIETNFSEEFVKRYNSEESLAICKKIWESLNTNKSFDDLTAEELESLKYCDEFEGNPWTHKFQGCSWYCGGVVDNVKSNTADDLTEKIHDGDYGTAWVIENSIQNKWIEYTFDANSSRVSEIIFVNGFIRADSLFKKYARVKKLQMFINNKPYAILHLEDQNKGQIIEFKPIGHRKKKDHTPVKNNKWSIKFEIIEVYHGEITAIALTEIYFDGDGHE